VKKNVVLLALNAKYVHSSLAVWALASGVARYARHPHNVTVAEATVHDKTEDIAELAAKYSPDVVGISTYIWNAPKLPELLSFLRKRLPGAIFVLGGPEAAHNESYWLAQGADVVLKGEGERSFAELLDGPADAGTISAPEEFWPNPYTAEYLASLKGRIAYLETSRGCPFRCAFCLSAGTGVRFLPTEDAKERILKLSHSGARTIKLVDRTFNCDPERAYGLFEFILSLDSPCVYHFEVAPDLFDGRTLRLLADAPPGRIQLEAGLQSFYPPALEAISRKTNLQKAGENIKTILQAGNIHLHIDLIAGLPGETLSHFQHSFNLAFSLGAHNLQVGFLKLLRGSVLREQAEGLGIRYGADPPYEITESPWLSREDLAVLKNAENALRHTANKSRFLSSLEYVMRVSALSPFDLFRLLGKAAPNHGTALDTYAGQIYEALAELPGADRDELLDLMARDWLSMVKSKNIPRFLRGNRSWKEVYADPARKNPVTGLWAVEFIDI
jgi:hypothetical protein